MLQFDGIDLHRMQGLAGIQEVQARAVERTFAALLVLALMFDEGLGNGFE